MQTMLLEVTATMWALSWEAATLSMMMSCLSSGTLREFSRWSSCSSGQGSRALLPFAQDEGRDQGRDQGRGQRVAADQQLERIGAQVGLEVVAVASQPRPDWKGGEEREEHLVALLAV